MCARSNQGGKLNPELPLTELSLEDIKTILPNEFVAGLFELYICGNFGDPLFARDTLDIFRYLRKINPELYLTMVTNGSARSEEWWRELASLGVRVHFSIDGLKDTNHIYRRGTSWAAIEHSLWAFTRAGGEAEWDFIVFKHNEHQIEDIKKFASKFGITQVNIKNTSRFFSNSELKFINPWPARTSTDEIEYYIEAPSNSQYVNRSMLSEQFQDRQTVEHMANAPIRCQSIVKQEIFISCEGLVFPCCWTATQIYSRKNQINEQTFVSLIEKLPQGLDELNAKKRPIGEILRGSFFSEILPNSWTPQPKRRRPFVCEKFCSGCFTPSSPVVS